MKWNDDKCGCCNALLDGKKSIEAKRHKVGKNGSFEESDVRLCNRCFTQIPPSVFVPIYKPGGPS